MKCECLQLKFAKNKLSGVLLCFLFFSFFFLPALRSLERSFGSILDGFQRSYFSCYNEVYFRVAYNRILFTIFLIISSLVICFFFLLAENQTDRRKASKQDIKQHQSKEFGHPVHSCWFLKITFLILAELLLITTHNEALHAPPQNIFTSESCARLCFDFHSMNKIMATGCANCLNMEGIF